MKVLPITGVAGLVTGLLLAGLYRPGPVEPVLAKKADAPRKLTLADLSKAVARGESSPDPLIKRAGIRAQMQLASQDAIRKDYSSAREKYADAEKKALELKVPGEKEPMDPAFGSQSDQGAYQAIVCLAAEGHKDEALNQFRKFIKERPLSPLCKAAHERIVRLVGKATAEDDALFQSAIDAQDKDARYEMAMCGPKVLERILPLLGKENVGYLELAKECGTTSERGTTMDGLRRALRSRGVESVGLELNRSDFAKLVCPVVLLSTDHYVAVLEIKESSVRVYDPRYNAEITQTLPPMTDANFRATVLSPSVPNASYLSTSAGASQNKKSSQSTSKR